MEAAGMDAAPGVPQAERRHATVVKCDIVGSTRINQGLDLDGQLAFKRGWESLASRIAARHAGHVERFEGDGALVTFGWPAPSEDAAESAVRMAVELAEAIATADFAPRELQVRIGIATGAVAVLKRPEVSKSESIAGTTIDLAERLRAAAAPGEVVVCNVTKRVAGLFFEYLDLGAIALKGFEQPVQAWRVAGMASVSSRFQAQRARAPNMTIIGRGEALEQLAAAWTRALGGEGNAVCLSGDAGMGKSRLAIALLERAVADGAAVLQIECTPSTRNSPLFPIGVLLRRVAEIERSMTETQVRARADELLRRYLDAAQVADALACLGPLFGLASTAAPASDNPQELRDRTIAVVVRMLQALAEQRPVALLCEDLHWVDDTTAEVLTRVRAEIGGFPALLIMTLRPDGWAPPLPQVPTIRLAALPAPVAAEMVRSVARGAALSEERIHRIVERSEGVPLVLEELTRDLVEAAGDEGLLSSDRPDNAPRTLELLVQSRLARRPDLTPIVQAAAILGREFSIPLLEQMLPAEVRAQPGRVERALETMAADGVLASPDSGAHDRAQFKHALIWEAVYHTLLGSDRQRMHSHAANLLAGEHKATPDAAPDVVAEHLVKARRYREAIHTRLAASAQTVARGAYVEAEGHCTAALELTGEIADADEQRTLKFQILLQQGVARTGRYGYSSQQVEDTYREARGVCGETAEAQMLYPIMRGLATVNLVRGKLAASYELSQKSLALAEQSCRPEFVIDAMSVCCYTALYFGSLHECRGWIVRCLELYHREHGEALTYPVPHDAGVAAMSILPTVEWLMGDSAACERAISAGLAHVERGNRDFDKAYLHSWIAGIRTTQRRFAEAIEHAQIAVGISQRNGYREWLVTGMLIQLLAGASLKSDPEALAQAGEMCAALAREGVGLNASWYLWALARGHRTAGNAEVARQLLAEAGRRAEASGETRMNSELLLLQAELEPDVSAALRLLRSALAIAEEQGGIANALRAAAALTLRISRDKAAQELGRGSYVLLEGRSDYPQQADWMRERLAALRRAMKAQAEATERA